MSADKWSVFIDPERKDRCAYIDCGKTCVAHVFSPDLSLRDKNAALISAAPELLDALQRVVLISDRKHDAWDAAKAAIDKALGKRS